MKKILIITNSINGLYSFRKELAEELLAKGYNVYISAPNDTRTGYFDEIGCKMHETRISRRGTNPNSDFKLLRNYFKIIKTIKPDIVLTYTIKPNVYGGIACRLMRVPQIANITGLGTAVESRGTLQKITIQLYRVGLRKAKCIFFQNEDNMEFMQTKNIGANIGRLIPGSGVNISHHNVEAYPPKEEKIKILYIGRLMKAKGIDELFDAVKTVKDKHPTVEFHFIGRKEENYDAAVNDLVEKKLIIYHGVKPDVHEYIKKAHVLINPSYHEGMSNVLLEAASTGRPVLASDVPGCKETFDEGISGFAFIAKDTDSMVKTILKFIDLPYEDKKNMGIAGRGKIEREYDRNIVVQAYLEEIERTIGVTKQ